MIKSLIVILSLPHVVSTFEAGVVFNIPKKYMELPPVEANEFATKGGLNDKGRALLKVLFWKQVPLHIRMSYCNLLGLMSDEDKEFFNRLDAKDSGTLMVVSNTTTNDEQFLAGMTKKSPIFWSKVQDPKCLGGGKACCAQARSKGLCYKCNGISMEFLQRLYEIVSFSCGRPYTIGVIEKSRALSDDAREDIKKEFPKFAVFLTSAETGKRLQEH